MEPAKPSASLARSVPFHAPTFKAGRIASATAPERAALRNAMVGRLRPDAMQGATLSGFLHCLGLFARGADFDSAIAEFCVQEDKTP
jgi:hypothetical protein